MDDLIELSSYDAGWPAAFAAERDAVRAELGGRIGQVEHIGSTAVPGMAAKPTIDIMVGVEDLVVDDTVVGPLAARGYRYLGEYGIPGRHFFRKGSPPTHHLHWVRTGGDFWWKQVVFRDYMRAAAEDARAYETLKRGLADRFHNDRARYTASKSEFVSSALERAWRWSKAPLVVFDLEATCWESGTVLERQETIEIGAVRLGADFAAVSEFQRLIRPKDEPTLSPFCLRLTGIRQEEVDAAQEYPAVLASFADWGGPGPIRYASWSTYDLRQLRSDCRRHGVPLPPALESHVDLRQRFAEARKVEPPTMKRALELLGLPLEGAHHRGLDDARNTARMARAVMGPA
ncbi:MAG: GrpB family protein [Elusimicrobia bacterium]|nr:GrpB family protein [Elusimicrobiota bacterium]